ncbi:hypothetical protein A2361_00020 [Candidatus Woesebacteria bacterium RIFOXYB1_FULL_40_26]|uniref:LytR/CpsA/Psr regulator C-terminal domain-containing protein n=2 Tax=Candidatus Woeseibacteriota TaxID=1752722 RepID=A0A1F8DDZ5_9BACT|nr:MAG: hypothetical protein A2361_00020 [Candidatus Woesebacteria bacterium RIFOXYB1_FULL_40_26]OGM86833.1 MAG: hypothetical protein A2614_02665 [Candidatus Woesebacteria bacterium RIFOXYD1_FULL_40_21]
MNENTPVSTNPTPSVGFPVSQPQKPAGKMNKWVIIFIGLLLLGAGGVFFFATRSANEPATTATPESGDTSIIPTPEPTESPKPIDRSKVKIEIQNGTGITGEGAYLQGVLANLGYKNIKTANASNQDSTTTVVTFAKTLDAGAIDEIASKLEEVYKAVDTKTSSTITTDVLIVTGLRKGATAKPSASPTPKPTPTASPSATPTATPTATPQ